MKRLIGMLLLALATSGVHAENDRCGGGDGPKPFNDISKSMQFRVKPMDARGGIKEFLLWEQSNTVVYRNSRNEVRGLQTSGTGDVHYPFTTSAYPLDRVADPKGTSLLFSGVAWLFNRLDYHWSRFSNIKPMNHLFWYKNYIYSYSERNTDDGKKIAFYRYKEGDVGSSEICTFTPGEYDVKIGHGHQFPEAVLYYTTPITDGEMLNIIELDVERCRYERLEKRMYNTTKEVFRFRQLGSYAVQVDHPRSNLLWWTPNGCNYFDIDSRRPFILNYAQPVIATWAPNRDISLFFLNNSSSAHLLTGLPIRELGENDLYMAGNGHDVYLSPLFEGEKAKWLLKLDLNSPR